ncbi:MAG: glycosyltransferase [Deltaproteobacteria bacterium]|nr:glycosyltransferase [Deltaproteobacteria bacterium]
MAELIATLAIVFWVATFIRAQVAIRRTPRLTAAPPGRPPPHVVALVPVRDEADGLRPFLAALAAQRGVRLDALFYDDGSTDGSASLLDAAAAGDPSWRVVHGSGELPAGWCGKTHALTRGLEAYGGGAELLLFIDADVELAPDAVAALVAALEVNRADVVSPLPELACDGFWAGLLGPNFASVATLRFPPPRVNDAADQCAFLNGQAMLFRRAAYAASGGFAAVRGEVLEDVALAQRAKAQGLRLLVVDGQALVRTRMYGTLAEHVAGWSKNLFALLGSSRRRALGVAGFVLLMSWLPLASLLAGLAAAIAGDRWSAAAGAVGWLLPTSFQIALRARARAAPLFAPLAPLASAIVAATLVRVSFGRSPLTWKGRAYANPRAAASVASRLSDGRGSC